VIAARQRAMLAAGIAVGVSLLILVLWPLHLVTAQRYDSGLAKIQEPLTLVSNQPAGEITPQLTVAESVVATEDNLSEVDVQLATFNRPNDAALVLTISDSLGGPPLRQVEARPSQIVDNAYHAFAFDPLGDSLGKTYFVTIASPDGRPGDAFTVWVGYCDCYPAGQMYVNGQPQEGRDLAMTLTYDSGASGIWELVNRMSQYKPEIAKGVGLIVLGLMAASLALAGLALFAKRVFEQEAASENVPPAWIGASVLCFLFLFAVVELVK